MQCTAGYYSESFKKIKEKEKHLRNKEKKSRIGREQVKDVLFLFLIWAPLVFTYLMIHLVTFANLLEGAILCICGYAVIFLVISVTQSKELLRQVLFDPLFILFNLANISDFVCTLMGVSKYGVEYEYSDFIRVLLAEHLASDTLTVNSLSYFVIKILIGWSLAFFITYYIVVAGEEISRFNYYRKKITFAIFVLYTSNITAQPIFWIVWYYLGFWALELIKILSIPLSVIIIGLTLYVGNRYSMKKVELRGKQPFKTNELINKVFTIHIVISLCYSVSIVFKSTSLNSCATTSHVPS